MANIFLIAIFRARGVGESWQYKRLWSLITEFRLRKPGIIMTKEIIRGL
jgi:hypothetical protein